MARVRVGDQVVVISGNSKGRTGKVLRVLAEQDKVVVEGVNLVKRHTKATPQQAGGIIEKPAAIAVGKVMLVDPQTGKPTRVHYEERDGKKVRVAKSGAVIAAEQS